MGRETVQMEVSGYADDGSSQKSRKAPGRVGESQRGGPSGIRRSKSFESRGRGGGGPERPRGRKSVRPGLRTIPWRGASRFTAAQNELLQRS